MQLLLAHGDELEAVADLFADYKANPVVPKNAAKHSGAIKWVRGLLERIEAPMEKIRLLSKLVLDTEEARGIFARQAALVQAGFPFSALSHAFGHHKQQMARQLILSSCIKLKLRCAIWDQCEPNSIVMHACRQ